MPKELTHFSLAQKAIENADNNDIKKIIIDNYPLFLASSVMIDTPLYHIYGKTSKQLWNKCSLYHNTDRNSFKPIISVLKCSGDKYTFSEAIAFSMGLISHICADITFHPFVYFFTGKDDFPAHAEFETILDIYHLVKGDTKKNSLKKIIQHNNLSKDKLSHMLSAFYDTNPEPMIEAINRHMILQEIFMIKGFHTVCKLLNLFPWINLNKEKALSYPSGKNNFARLYFDKYFLYRHPVTGENIYKSIPDITTTYLSKFHNIFTNINQHLNSKKDLFFYIGDLNGENLSTGLHGVKTSKMSFFALK